MKMNYMLRYIALMVVIETVSLVTSELMRPQRVSVDLREAVDKQTNVSLYQRPNTNRNRIKRSSDSNENQDLSTKTFIVLTSCNSDAECNKFESKCENNVCNCPPKFVDKLGLENIHAYGNSESGFRKSNSGTRYCHKAAVHGEPCSIDEQCVTKNSVCFASFSGKDPKKVCSCRQNYIPADGFEKVTVGKFDIISKLVCHHHEAPSNTFYILVIIGGLIAIILLTSCLIILIKMRTQKQRPMSDTLTRLAPATVPAGNGMAQQQPPFTGMQQQHQQQVHPHQQQHANYNQQTAVGQAVMGSAEAEFQNDFIAVFPMHHLEPCPEKNTTALLM